ncbi:MAG: hypothetical protein ACREFE_08540 [Limisphaerales bacterium]
MIVHNFNLPGVAIAPKLRDGSQGLRAAGHFPASGYNVSVPVNFLPMGSFIARSQLSGGALAGQVF